MGKKKTKKVALAVPQPQPETMTTVGFGYEEMLSELEATLSLPVETMALVTTRRFVDVE